MYLFYAIRLAIVLSNVQLEEMYLTLNFLTDILMELKLVCLPSGCLLNFFFFFFFFFACPLSVVHAGEGGAAGTVFDGSGARVSRREEEPRAGLCGQTHPLRGGAPELEEAVSASGQGDCTCKEAGPQNPEAKIGARGVFLGGSNACQERNRD